MSKELNTLAPKKWLGDFSGTAPSLDTNDDIRVGDLAIETGTTNTDDIWQCLDNSAGAPIWENVSASLGNWKKDTTTLKPKTSTDTVQIIPPGGTANTIPITDANGVAQDTTASIESAPTGGSMLGLEIYASEPTAPSSQDNLYAVQKDSNTITLVVSNGTDVFKVDATKV